MIRHTCLAVAVVGLMMVHPSITHAAPPPGFPYAVEGVIEQYVTGTTYPDRRAAVHWDDSASGYVGLYLDGSISFSVGSLGTVSGSIAGWPVAGDWSTGVTGVVIAAPTPWGSIGFLPLEVDFGHTWEPEVIGVDFAWGFVLGGVLELSVRLLWLVSGVFGSDIKRLFR